MSAVFDDATAGPQRAPRQALTSWLARVFAACGMPDDDSRLAAEVMARCNARGYETHGVTRVMTYVQKFAAGEINPDQGYLSNRIRPQGVVEKCHFCLHRTRRGKLPACAEACPTGARVFGNLLDPDSPIRWVLDNKRVFVLKEELGTRPRFFYFFDV